MKYRQQNSRVYIYDNAYHKFKPVADYERGYIKLTRLAFIHTYILYKVVSYGSMLKEKIGSRVTILLKFGLLRECTVRRSRDESII